MGPEIPQQIPTWSGLAAIAVMAMLQWAPKLLAWVGRRMEGAVEDMDKGRKAHYDDLRGFIRVLEERINKTEAKVDACEARHDEVQKQYIDMAREFTRQIATTTGQMEFLRQQNEALLRKQNEERLIAQATAETMKAHPELWEAMKENDAKIPRE